MRPSEACGDIWQSYSPVPPQQRTKAASLPVAPPHRPPRPKRRPSLEALYGIDPSSLQPPLQPADLSHPIRCESTAVSVVRESQIDKNGRRGASNGTPTTFARLCRDPTLSAHTLLSGAASTGTSLTDHKYGPAAGRRVKVRCVLLGCRRTAAALSPSLAHVNPMSPTSWTS